MAVERVTKKKKGNNFPKRTRTTRNGRRVTGFQRSARVDVRDLGVYRQLGWMPQKQHNRPPETPFFCCPSSVPCLSRVRLHTDNRRRLYFTHASSDSRAFFFLSNFFFFVLRTTCHQPRLRHCINNSMIPTLGDATVTWHDIVLGEGETGERTIL